MIEMVDTQEFMDKHYYRYNSDAHVVDFLADDSLETTWQSASGEMWVVLTLGLNSTISLSKVFIRFQSPLPLGAQLQYYPNASTSWQDLQYFADDCITRFDMANNAE